MHAESRTQVARQLTDPEQVDVFRKEFCQLLPRSPWWQKGGMAANSQSRVYRGDKGCCLHIGHGILQAGGEPVSNIRPTP
jgi:hypothetical protein